MSPDKTWRRNAVSQALREAALALQKAADKLATAAEAYEQVEKARAKVAEATQAAVSHVEVEGKKYYQRQGLPARLRHRIETKARELDALAAEIKAWPVTRDEKLLAQRAKRQPPTPTPSPGTGQALRVAKGKAPPRRSTGVAPSA